MTRLLRFQFSIIGSLFIWLVTYMYSILQWGVSSNQYSPDSQQSNALWGQTDEYLTDAS